MVSQVIALNRILKFYCKNMIVNLNLSMRKLCQGNRSKATIYSSRQFQSPINLTNGVVTTHSRNNHKLHLSIPRKHTCSGGTTNVPITNSTMIMKQSHTHTQQTLNFQKNGFRIPWNNNWKYRSNDWGYYCYCPIKEQS